MYSENNVYSYNNQDYYFTVRLYNGINDVYLSNTIWDQLLIEEDIFDWKIKGSIIIDSPYESIERESEEASTATKLNKNNIIY